MTFLSVSESVPDLFLLMGWTHFLFLDALYTVLFRVFCFLRPFSCYPDSFTIYQLSLCEPYRVRRSYLFNSMFYGHIEFSSQASLVLVCLIILSFCV